jgi:hypothetical protein
MEGATAAAAHRPLEMETASRRQSAATRAWGSIGSAEIRFAEGTAYATTKWDVHHAGLARYRQGVVGGWWSLECMRAAQVESALPPPAPWTERRNGTSYPLTKGSNN